MSIMIGALRWITSAARTLTQDLSHGPEPAQAASNSDSVLLGARQGAQDNTIPSVKSTVPRTEASAPSDLSEGLLRVPGPSQSGGVDWTSSVPTVMTDGDLPPLPQALCVPRGLDTEPRNQTTEQLRREASDRYCEALGEWARRLTQENLDPQELQRVSQVLAGVAAETPFPLVRDVARTLLQDYFEWQDPVTDWSIKLGAIDGPTQYIQRVGRDAGDLSSHYFDASSRISEFVDALENVCARAAVPQNALKIVTHSAYIWRHRAETETNKDVRKHESVDFDRGLSEKFASLIEKWWRNDQVSVLLDDQPVAPGFDVKKAICSEQVAVRDGAIHLRSAVPDPPADVLKLAEQIENESCKGVNEKEARGLVALRDLARTDFARALAVVGVMLQNAERCGMLDGLVLGLKGAANDAPLRNVFRPFLPRLATLVSDADARAWLATDNDVGRAQADLFGGLVEAFSEGLDARIVARELGPLLRTSNPKTARRADDVATKLMNKRPDLMAAVVGCITSAEPVENDRWGGVLVEAAEKHGWVPDDEQMDWLRRRLWMPVGKNKLSMFEFSSRADGFLNASHVLNVLKKCHPDILDKILIPDTQFHMQPARDAVFDRIYNDPNDDQVPTLYRQLYTWKLGHAEDWGPAYSLGIPDAKRVQELLSKVQTDLQAGRHIRDEAKIDGEDYIGLDAQKALVVLISMQLDDEEQRQLETMVGPEVYHSTEHFAFRYLMDPLRRRTAAEALARLAQTPRSAPETFATASDLLTLWGATSKPLNSTYEERYCAALIQNAFGKVPPADLAAERDRRFHILEAWLKQHGLEDLSERELADTQLLSICASMDATFSKRLRETLRPYCYSRVSDGLVQRILKGLRAELRDKDFERLRAGDLSRADRAVQLDAIVEKATRNCEDFEVTPQAISAAVEGLRHTRGVEDLPDFFASPEESYDFYDWLVPESTDDEAIAAEWAKVRDVFVHMGGPVFTRDDGHRRKALELYQFVEERVAAGEPRDKALQHALTCYFNNRDPRKTPEYDDEEARRKAAGSVVTHERTVTIGGVEVPRNVDRSA